MGALWVATEKMLLEMKGRVFNRASSQICNVPLKGWIIDPDEHCLLDSPSDVVCLPVPYREIVHTDTIPRGVTIVTDGERSPEMFFQPFPQNPYKLPCVFPFTIYLVTLLPVDYPTFLSDKMHVFWATRKSLRDVPPLK